MGPGFPPGTLCEQRTNMKLISNPPNPWSSTQIEWLEEPPEAKLEVFVG